ncbi:hypothetical protein LAZ67_7001785 [Cordylochernes scorpioides]|uniref:Helix-turn-helix domain-containing protein n=1 Tax=Cordylochernes scorpioides TaxID=51811 RepID=A0ABY6KMN8_9ARAC|nr:hypothetical protein LAZ67_7001785 [Cordylochernes scorpioides]
MAYIGFLLPRDLRRHLACKIWPLVLEASCCKDSRIKSGWHLACKIWPLDSEAAARCKETRSKLGQHLAYKIWLLVLEAARCKDSRIKLGRHLACMIWPLVLEAARCKDSRIKLGRHLTCKIWPLVLEAARCKDSRIKLGRHLTCKIWPLVLEAARCKDSRIKSGWHLACKIWPLDSEAIQRNKSRHLGCKIRPLVLEASCCKDSRIKSGRHLACKIWALVLKAARYKDSRSKLGRHFAYKIWLLVLEAARCKDSRIKLGRHLASKIWPLILEAARCKDSRNKSGWHLAFKIWSLILGAARCKDSRNKSGWHLAFKIWPLVLEAARCKDSRIKLGRHLAYKIWPLVLKAARCKNSRSKSGRHLACKIARVLDESKLHFMDSHLNLLPDNLGAESEEQGERFHQDIKIIEQRYNGFWNQHMVADYCWNLMLFGEEEERGMEAAIRYYIHREREYKRYKGTDGCQWLEPEVTVSLEEGGKQLPRSDITVLGARVVIPLFARKSLQFLPPSREVMPLSRYIWSNNLYIPGSNYFLFQISGISPSNLFPFSLKDLKLVESAATVLEAIGKRLVAENVRLLPAEAVPADITSHEVGDWTQKGWLVHMSNLDGQTPQRIHSASAMAEMEGREANLCNNQMLQQCTDLQAEERDSMERRKFRKRNIRLGPGFQSCHDMAVQACQCRIHLEQPVTQHLHWRNSVVCDDWTEGDGWFMDLGEAVNIGISLTKICLCMNTFTYSHTHFKQIRGTPMGSPLSSILSEITMSTIDQWICNRQPSNIFFWRRYVDDIFCVCKTDSENIIFTDLHTYNPNITFTLEREHELVIPFLDVLVIRTPNTYHTTVYYKKNHPPRYTHYRSHCPTSHKINIVKALTRRLLTHCSLPIFKTIEKNRIISHLTISGFPLSFIEKHTYSPVPLNPPATYKSTCVIPFSPLSVNLSRFLKPFGIRTFFTNTPNLHSLLRHPITKTDTSIDPLTSTGAVYSVSCQQCPATYVGETGRTIAIRMSEHTRNITNRDTRSLIFQHIASSGHSFDTTNPTIHYKNISNLHQRLVLEAIVSTKLHKLTATGHVPRWRIGKQPSDMTASCETSRITLTNKQLRTKSSIVRKKRKASLKILSSTDPVDGPQQGFLSRDMEELHLRVIPPSAKKRYQLLVEQAGEMLTQEGCGRGGRVVEHLQHLEQDGRVVGRGGYLPQQADGHVLHLLVWVPQTVQDGVVKLHQALRAEVVGGFSPSTLGLPQDCYRLKATKNQSRGKPPKEMPKKLTQTRAKGMSVTCGTSITNPEDTWIIDSGDKRNPNNDFVV